MRFKLEYTVRELRIRPDESLRFEYGGPHLAEVVLRPPSEDEQSRGHKHQNAFCTACSQVDPSEKVAAVFSQIAGNEILPGDASDQVATEYCTPNGTRVRIPSLSKFPEHFQSFVGGVVRELHDLATRTISVLRWRANDLGPHNPISTRGARWSNDETFWHPMPAEHHVRAEVHRGPRITKQVQSDVNSKVVTGGDAPLHHDLFREAWEQRYANPRSSLVIGIAAAEIAVKHCISALVPEAEWLALNLPTPPLARMLTEYFPRLPAKCDFDGHVKQPPRHLLDDLKKGVTMRNQLAHAGSIDPCGESVEVILLSVHDLLWIVDYYTGNSWAIEFLRSETLAALTTTQM
jgi:hypothetical protein